MMQLIANRWYAVLSSAELGSKRPVGARRFGLDLVFWRPGPGRVAASEDVCPHRKAKLSIGRVVDGCMECPFHGFRFAESGECTLIPAHLNRAIPKAMSVEALTVREEHGFVWLWSGPDSAPDGPLPFFDVHEHTFAGSEFTVPVATHYTRGIENQLDFTHLPFVHRTTIGRFIDHPIEVTCEIDGDRIKAHAGNAEAFVELIGPNIWRNITGPMWQFLAFVPIDDEHMLYYVRTYQRRSRIPGLRWLMGKVLVLMNRVIIGQDTAVVESQPAEETRVRGMDEILVPSDAAIIAYRRWRDEHRQAERRPAPASAAG